MTYNQKLKLALLEIKYYVQSRNPKAKVSLHDFIVHVSLNGKVLFFPIDTKAIADGTIQDLCFAGHVMDYFDKMKKV